MDQITDNPSVHSSASHRPGHTIDQAAIAAIGAHRRHAKRRGRRYVVIVVTLIALAAPALGIWSWWRTDRQSAESLVTVAVETGDVEDSTTALGNLQPRDYVDVGTQVSGQLRTLHFEVGAAVKKGDLLAEIDPTVYLARVDADRAQLLNLRAQLADKEAQQALAQQQRRRQANLAKANATSQEAVQQSEAALRSATAQVEALRAQIQQTESTLKGDEANLSYTKIYAPMSGTIVSQTARQGQTLNANQQAPIILRIADLSTMTVWTQVSEADVAKLRLGMDAYFTTLGQPESRRYGKLRQILPTPEVVNNVILYDALFDVPNAGNDLMTQMTAQVFFVSAAAKNVLLVPISALRPAGGGAKQGGADPAANGYLVKVATGNDVVEERRVAIGVSNRVMAEVTSGLTAGERVVIDNRPASPRRTTPAVPTRPPRLS